MNQKISIPIWILFRSKRFLIIILLFSLLSVTKRVNSGQMYYDQETSCGQLCTIFMANLYDKALPFQPKDWLIREDMPLSMVDMKKMLEGLGLNVKYGKKKFSRLEKEGLPAIIYLEPQSSKDTGHFIVLIPDRENESLYFEPYKLQVYPVSNFNVFSDIKYNTLQVIDNSRDIESPKVRLSTEVIDLGDIDHDSQVDAVVELTNLSDYPIFIKKLKSSCICIDTSIDKDFLWPEEKTNCHFRLDMSTKDFSGEIHLKGAVYLERVNEPIMVDIVAIVHNRAITYPAQVIINNAYKGQSLEYIVNMTVDENYFGIDPKKLVSTISSETIGKNSIEIKVNDIKKIETLSRYQVGLSLALNQDIPEGNIDDIISLSYSDGKLVEIPVYIQIHGLMQTDVSYIVLRAGQQESIMVTFNNDQSHPINVSTDKGIVIPSIHTSTKDNFFEIVLNINDSSEYDFKQGELVRDTIEIECPFLKESKIVNIVVLPKNINENNLSNHIQVSSEI